MINGEQHQPVDLTAQRYANEEILDFDHFFASVYATTGGQQVPTDVSLELHHDQDKQSVSWCLWMHDNVSLAVVTENSPARLNTNLSELQLRCPHPQHSANVIIQSLRAFPTMMLRRETFPWFIHPDAHVLSGSTESALPEVLTNCMSIAQMFVSQTPETRHFLRQNIAAEYRRCTSEVRQWLTLSSNYADDYRDASDV